MIAGPGPPSPGQVIRRRSPWIGGVCPNAVIYSDTFVTQRKNVVMVPVAGGPRGWPLTKIRYAGPPPGLPSRTRAQVRATVRNGMLAVRAYPLLVLLSLAVGVSAAVAVIMAGAVTLTVRPPAGGPFPRPGGWSRSADPEAAGRVDRTSPARARLTVGTPPPGFSARPRPAPSATGSFPPLPGPISGRPSATPSASGSPTPTASPSPTSPDYPFPVPAPSPSSSTPCVRMGQFHVCRGN